MKYSYSSFKELLDKEIEKAKSIVITAHISPDDDAISSVLAMYSYIKSNFKDKDVKVVYESQDPNYLRFGYFNYYKDIRFAKSLLSEIKEDDLIILLDVFSIQRCTAETDIKLSSKNTVIGIDHHKTESGKEVHYHFNKNETSTAETLFNLLFKSTGKTDKKTAEILLLGIFGDTGYLNYIGKDNSATFTTVLELLNIAGINSIEAFKQKYSKNTLKEIKALALFLDRAEIIKVDGWPAFYFSYFDRKDAGIYSEKEIKAGYALAHVHLKNISEVECGLIVKYRQETYQLSFRSVEGSVNVRVIAENFNGSGHDVAAGGSIEITDKSITVDTAREEFIMYLKTHKPVLI